MAFSDYQLVEYIESSGTQYIDTGVKPSDYVMTLRIEGDMAWVVSPQGTSTSQFLFGTGYYNSTANSRRTICVGYNQSLDQQHMTYLNGAQLGTGVTFTGSTLDTTRRIYGIDQVNKNYIYGDQTQAFTTTVNSNLTNALIIFASRQSSTSGTPVTSYATARCYGFKIWNNDTLIRDFVPVKRKSDSVIGLYDRVNDTFYTNQGTGNFTAGADAFMISTDVSPSGSGTVTGGGLYASGTTVTLTADAKNLRYEFEQWGDGSTTNPRTITVTEDAEYIAEFLEVVPSGRLPNRLVPCDMLRSSNVYFDTGLLPKDTMNITFMGGYTLGFGDQWFFGSRNTNSNTSAGQFNLFGNATTWYIGYNNSRIKGGFYFKNNGIEFESIEEDDNSGYDVVTYNTGSSGSFTGNYPMYILALNNGGNVEYGALNNAGFIEMQIEEGGVVTHHFVPVYDTTGSEFGIYDLITGDFLTNQGTGAVSGYHLLEVNSNGGGEAYIKSDSTGLSKSKYMKQTGTLTRTSFWVVAEPDSDHEFLYWSDSNGIVSSDREYLITKGISADTVLTANFIEKSPYEQTQNYQLLGLQYGVGYPDEGTDPQANLSNIYAEVVSFDISNDMLAKSTSTLVLKEVPSLYQVDMPVFLYSPKGKLVWCGLIKSIDGNTLTCREALSIYDSDILFRVNNGVYNGNESLYQMISNIANSYKYRATQNSTDLTGYKKDNSLERKIATLRGMLFSKKVYFGEDLITLPAITENAVGNLEDYLFTLSDKYGVMYEPYLDSYVNQSYISKGAKHLLKFEVTNPLKYDPLTIGNNTEPISNINVLEEYQTPTTVTIVNTACTTMRGVYTIKDGVIVDMPQSNIEEWGGLTPDYISYNISDYKLIMSDDRLKTLAIENLGNAGYNHKITFNVDLNYGLYSFDDFKLGRKVNFYNNDRLYRSVITALRFSTDMNTMSVTLGNVRTKLTTKLNLGKVKK